MYPIRPWLYVGRFADTSNLPLMQLYRVGAMLELAAPVTLPGIERLYLAVEDGKALDAALIRQGVAFVRAHKAAGKTVLVACGAGISRSVTFAVAALKEDEGLSLTDAFREVCLKHPTAMPHPELWGSLCDYYGEARPDDYQIMRLLDDIRRENTP